MATLATPAGEDIDVTTLLTALRALHKGDFSARLDVAIGELRGLSELCAAAHYRISSTVKREAGSRPASRCVTTEAVLRGLLRSWPPCWLPPLLLPPLRPPRRVQSARARYNLG